MSDFGYVLRKNFRYLNFHTTFHSIFSSIAFMVSPFFFFLTLKYLAHLEFISVWGMNLTIFSPEMISSLSQHVPWLILPFSIDLKRHLYTCTSSHVLLWHFLWASHHDERWWHLLGEPLWLSTSVASR